MVTPIEDLISGNYVFLSSLQITTILLHKERVQLIKSCVLWLILFVSNVLPDKERNKVEFEITEFEREARRQALLEKGAVRIKQNELIKAKRLELFVRSCITFWKEWAR